MRWATRDFIHVDRVASPWLIKRFIDPEATFLFVPWVDPPALPENVIPFAIPGAELGTHDSAGTTFQKLLDRYGLGHDPALLLISRVISSLIQYVLHKQRPAIDDEVGQIGVGLMAIAEGVLIVVDEDGRILESSMVIYDALYAYFTAQRLFKSGGRPVPAEDGKGPTNMILQLRSLLAQHPRTTPKFPM